MSDPNAAEPAPPPQPPRPTARSITTTEESQLAADERYARQLAEHYNGAPVYERTGYPPEQRRGQQKGQFQQNPEERERNFIDGS